ncbi:MAG: hypothetical protein R3C28_04430 [Pirellulaceae bacterium]
MMRVRDVYEVLAGPTQGVTDYKNREELLKLRSAAEAKHGDKYPYDKFWGNVPQELKDLLQCDIKNLVDKHSEVEPKAVRRLIKAERERQNGQT